MNEWKSKNSHPIINFKKGAICLKLLKLFYVFVFLNMRRQKDQHEHPTENLFLITLQKYVQYSFTLTLHFMAGRWHTLCLSRLVENSCLLFYAGRLVRTMRLNHTIYVRDWRTKTKN